MRKIPHKKRVLTQISKGGVTKTYDYIDPTVPKQPKEVHVRESQRQVKTDERKGMLDFLRRKKRQPRPEEKAEQFSEFLRKE